MALTTDPWARTFGDDVDDDDLFPPKRRRRQLGTEKNAPAPSVLHTPPTRRALSSARALLLLTALAWLAYCWQQVSRLVTSPFSIGDILQTLLYVGLVTLLTVSASSYLLARLGFMKQARQHQRAPRAAIDAFYTESRPTVTVLVPSYREERKVIFHTLLSAALQEYPDVRVVLLVDDPPRPTDARHRQALEDALEVPGEILELLDLPRRRADAALAAFEQEIAWSDQQRTSPDQLERLAIEYDAASSWLRSLAKRMAREDHVDDFFCAQVLRRPAADFDAISMALREAADAGAPVSTERARQLYRRLAWTFRAEITTFERKRYASLSHEANKAMNLNSYIGLMGGRYRVQDSPGGPVLIPVRSGAFDLEVPEPDYVLTLDADSILLPEYCLRLVHLLEQPGYEKVAIAQTPYSAYRNAPTRIERMAGATTDLQHIAHLGMTRYGATSWVGANAIIRKAALDSIRNETTEGGFTVNRYIEDRTVIEDTESTLDMRLAGWQLHNMPERLAYSATPPDFGALCVQRQRWANGGLLCLPKLRRLAKIKDGRRRHVRWSEWLLRANYLASLSWATLGLAILLSFPFDEKLLSAFALLTALPYFLAMSSDLKRCGYRRTDVLRLYGFNLLLLPVNGSGSLKSIGQAIGGQKIAFARTPKVRTRTVAPALFVVIPWLIIVWSTVTFINDVLDERWVHAAFAGLNASLTLYAVVAFHGLKNAFADMLLSARAWVQKDPVERERIKNPGWITVLYHGPAQPGEPAKVDALAAAYAAVDHEEDADTLHLPAPSLIDLRDRTAPISDPARTPAPAVTDEEVRS